MPSVALPLPHKIHAESAAKRRVPRVIAAQFGDGYSQRARDGLNHWVDSWDVGWIPLTHAEKNIVVAALDASGGVDVLLWQPPGESAVKQFILTPEGYSMRPVGSGHWLISAKLTQVFDL